MPIILGCPIRKSLTLTHAKSKEAYQISDKIYRNIFFVNYNGTSESSKKRIFIVTISITRTLQTMIYVEKFLIKLF